MAGVRAGVGPLVAGARALGPAVDLLAFYAASGFFEAALIPAIQRPISEAGRTCLKGASICHWCAICDLAGSSPSSHPEACR